MLIHIQGATDIDIDTSGVSMQGPYFDKRFTYLDRSDLGRPVIELKKNNVVNEHNQQLVS